MLWIIIWIAGAIAMYGAIIYNRLERLRQQLSNSRADMEMQVKLPAGGGDAPETAENKTAAAKKFFADTTREYNAELQKFPASLIARMFKFETEKLAGE